MGYYYTMTGCSVRIPADNIDRATERVHKEFVSETEDRDLAMMLSDVGLSFKDFDGNGDLVMWGGTSRYERAMNILASIAGLIEPSDGCDEAFIVWQGDEGTDYKRQVFKDGVATIQIGHAVINWS
jgi:hypothetical protein